MSRHPTQEVTFSESDVLLSTTDLSSKITYANEKFCEVAGFTLDEMRGHPHRLVRHKDMPKAAFANMWAALKSGKSWMGPVKNRCKSGDYYWVNAFVTPIKNARGEIVEYQSVRTKPSDELVKRASMEYQKLSQNKKSHCLKPISDATAFVTAGLVVLIAVEILSVILEGATWSNVFGVLAGGVLMTVLLRWRKKYLRTLKKAKAIYDNAMMVHLYSGQSDALGYFDLALDMQQAKLRAVVGRVSDASAHVYSNVKASSDNGDSVASLLYQQSEEVSQIATAMQQFSTTIHCLSETVNQAAETAGKVEQHTVTGKQSVDATLQDINDLDEQLRSASQEVSKLVEGNTLIQNILDEINAIAEQTNLLALNAAIEAARAGEQGRGFAVVADEVRSLAARTQQSTEQITQRIGNLQDASNRALVAMKQGTELSKQSVASARSSGESLSFVQHQVAEMAELNRSIATAVEEQSVVASQVAENLNSVRTLAETSGQHGEQSKVMNKQLRDQVDQQSSLIMQFS